MYSIRSLGSAALNCCMVAQGCIDAYLEYGVHCWDYAAGDIIVREAGGVSLYPTGISLVITINSGMSCFFFNLIGAPLDLMGRGVLVASSTELAQAMIPHVQHCNYQRDDQN